MTPPVLYAGGPCSCAPDRRVRFIVPDVPGCVAAVHCRADGETGQLSLRVHAIPRGATLLVRVPVLSP